jgi:hypothetical protein
MKKVLLFCLVVLLMAFSTPSQAGRPFIIEESGSFIAQGTPINTDSDPRTADLVITNGKGQGFGQTNTQSVIEWETFGTPAECAGNPGSLLASGSSVIRTVKGLVFAAFDQGTNCFDSNTNTAAITLDGEITGGTGFYEGASGKISVTGTVHPFLFTNSDAQFGGVELKARVTWNGH